MSASQASSRPRVSPTALSSPGSLYLSKSSKVILPVVRAKVLGVNYSFFLL
jgi:hypothetical protein